MKESVAIWHKKAMAIGLDRRSKDLRGAVLLALEHGKRGHLGASFSLIEILRVLYDDILRYRPDQPLWPGRDRFILSKGHGCLALYAILADKGFFAKDHLQRFCQSNALLGGHPDSTKIPGVEASTGSLGHGLSIGLGMALHALSVGDDARVFVVVGDGECNEGSVWEAAMSAGKRRLENLVVLIDYNKYQSYGPTSEVQELEPFADKWRAFGFRVKEVNGHDVLALGEILKNTSEGSTKPLAVICHTVKGKGIGYAENNLEWHHKSNIKEDEIIRLKQAVEQY